MFLRFWPGMSAQEATQSGGKETAPGEFRSELKWLDTVWKIWCTSANGTVDKVLYHADRNDELFMKAAQALLDYGYAPLYISGEREVSASMLSQDVSLSEVIQKELEAYAAGSKESFIVFFGPLYLATEFEASAGENPDAAFGDMLQRFLNIQIPALLVTRSTSSLEYISMSANTFWGGKGGK